MWRLDKDASRHTKNADVKEQSDEDSFSCSNSDNSASPVISSPTSPGTVNGLRTNTPHQSCSTDDNPVPTPSTAKELLRADGISPQKAPKTLKQISLDVNILAQLHEFTHKSKSKLTNSLLTKDRFKNNHSISAIGKHLGVHRQLGLNTGFTTLENQVLQFLKRPGKHDAVIIAKHKHQVYAAILSAHSASQIPLGKVMKIRLSYVSGIRAKFRNIKLVEHNSLNSLMSTCVMVTAS